MTRSRRVAVINESMAKLLWPGRDPLGRRFASPAMPSLGQITVIGLVGDVAQNVEETKTIAGAYVPHQQDPNQMMDFLVKSDREAGGIAKDMRAILLSMDPDQPLVDAYTSRVRRSRR
jgi:hypothetical protein